MDRVEGFFEARCQELKKEVKELQYTVSDLTVHRNELSERVNQLASRQPSWPQSYKPPKRHNTNQNR